MSSKNEHEAEIMELMETVRRNTVLVDGPSGGARATAGLAAAVAALALAILGRKG